MGHKVRPTSLRLGITRNWSSRWYASKKEFSDQLVQDQQIRSFVKHEFVYSDAAASDKLAADQEDDDLVIVSDRPTDRPTDFSLCTHIDSMLLLHRRTRAKPK